jgi:P-type Cu+ transporter
MQVDVAKAPASHVLNGQHFYFCNPHCLEKFRAHPEQYLSERSPDTQVVLPPAPPGARYTCPMDPEIVQDHPGPCPKCGMMLEPVLPSAIADHDPELTDLAHRFWVGVVLTTPVLILAMGVMLPGVAAARGGTSWLSVVEMVLTTPVVLWCGWPFFARAWTSLRMRSPNMFTLIALGVGAAYGYSVLAALAPEIFPTGFHGAGHGVELYFESAAVIVVLVLLGQLLEAKARQRASGALRQLIGLAPATARLVVDGSREEELPLELVQPGDRLRVRPGERVPVDGVVVSGRSNVDESFLTGESIPVEKGPDAKVSAGTLNGTGMFVMRAERVGADTLLAQVIRLVSEAQRGRAPIQRLVDRVAAYFVPAVLLISVATFLAWGFWGGDASWAHGLVSAVTVLIIACPCALGLATPMAVLVAVGRGASHGILVRQIEALETLCRADVLLIDKTGTLTEGKPRLVDTTPVAGQDAAELLRLAASLEKASEHPLAAAVVRGAEERGLKLDEVESFEAVPGRGVRGRLSGRAVVLGTHEFLADNGVDGGPLTQASEEQRRQGRTILLAAIDGRLAGFLAVADPIKANAAEALGQLRADGLRIIMVTGDSQTTAAAVAGQLGITEFHAQVLPTDKNQIVKKWQDKGNIVAMAGDGINDAPALAQAQVGIAMGAGADIAMESAGLTLIQGDLRGVVRARQLSRDTMRTIRQNLFLAFVYNAVSIPVAAGALFPPFGILISPMWGSLAMSLSSLSVVANSLRLRRNA